MPSSSDPSSVSSWQEAEEAAARHMRERLRFTDVRLSRAGADDGIDVKSREGIAQVKWYKTPVGIAEVQRLRGTTSGTEWALFYASVHGYTKSAKEAATRGNVALFTIFPTTGLTIAANHVAESLERTRSGLPQQKKDDGSLSLGAHMAVTRRHWELNSAVREFSDRVDKLKYAVRYMQHVLWDLGKYEPRTLDALRERFPMWPDDEDPPEFKHALDAFERATDWSSHFAEGIHAEQTAVNAYQENLLPRLPALTTAVIASVPVPRSLLNEWCDHWTEQNFQKDFRPRRKMPEDQRFREMLEQRIARGPSRMDLEGHAKKMALRVVK